MAAPEGSATAAEAVSVGGLAESFAATQERVEADVRYLAADELAGRATGSPGIELAAQYLEARFRESGLRPLPGSTGYRHPVPLELTEPPRELSIKIGGQEVGRDRALLLHAGAAQGFTRLVYLEHGTADEFAEAGPLDGAIVVTNVGTPETRGPQEGFGAVEAKRGLAAAAGARALVELYRSPLAKWSQVAAALGGTGVRIAEPPSGGDLPVIWVDDADGALLEAAREAAGTAARLTVVPTPVQPLPAANLVGYLPGTDPAMADEYILVGAHYDHVGTDGSRGGADSIFNGARDNALGVAALLTAARELAAAPARRPVFFAAWTAEERGLLGSRYFAEHPPLPLREVVFNLNFDGAGYTDTSFVVVNGYGRSTAQDAIDGAVASSGTQVRPDPVPDFGLFRASDNWNFARAGVPAINLAPGFAGFTPELMRYYHQPPDEAASLDFAYVARYARAGAAAARALANLSEAARFAEGDELKSVSDALYGDGD